MQNLKGYQIFTINRKTNIIKQITKNHDFFKSDAHFSYDGLKIVFISDSGAKKIIMVVNSDGSHQEIVGTAY